MNKQKFWVAASVSLFLLTSHAAHAQSGGTRDRLKAEKCYDTKGNPVSCDDQAKTDAVLADPEASNEEKSEAYSRSTSPKSPAMRLITPPCRNWPKPQSSRAA